MQLILQSMLYSCSMASSQYLIVTRVIVKFADPSELVAVTVYVPLSSSSTTEK